MHLAFYLSFVLAVVSVGFEPASFKTNHVIHSPERPHLLTCTFLNKVEARIIKHYDPWEILLWHDSLSKVLSPIVNYSTAVNYLRVPNTDLSYILAIYLYFYLSLSFTLSFFLFCSTCLSFFVFLSFFLIRSIFLSFSFSLSFFLFRSIYLSFFFVQSISLYLSVSSILSILLFHSFFSFFLS